MKQPLFVEPLLASLHCARGDQQAIHSTTQQIEKMNHLAVMLDTHYGEDAKQNVLQYQEVQYALQLLLSYHTDPSAYLTEEGAAIFHYFVINKLSQAERILQDELQVL